LGKLLKALWVCWFYFTFSVLFIIYLVPFVPMMKWKWSHNFLHFLRRWITKLQLLLAGVIIRKRIEGELPAPGAVFCFNHSSLLDILIPIASLNRQIRFIGKKELGRIPLFGIVFQHLDIPIDRESSIRAHETLEQVADCLHQGIDIFIAPEGTTSVNAPEMLPFKGGAFRLAEKAQVPIVPVVFLDNWRLFHYDKQWHGRPGFYRMHLLRPIAPSTQEGMKVKTREAMNRVLYVVS